MPGGVREIVPCMERHALTGGIPRTRRAAVAGVAALLLIELGAPAQGRPATEVAEGEQPDWVARFTAVARGGAPDSAALRNLLYDGALSRSRAHVVFREVLAETGWTAALAAFWDAAVRKAGSARMACAVSVGVSTGLTWPRGRAVVA